MESAKNPGIKNYQNEPAFPTTPVQDKFGQVILFFGLSKLELLAAIVANGYLHNQKNGAILFPEVVAQEALELAKHILKAGQENREEPNSGLHSIN